jgi:hypothetical protein
MTLEPWRSNGVTESSTQSGGLKDSPLEKFRIGYSDNVKAERARHLPAADLLLLRPYGIHCRCLLEGCSAVRLDPGLLDRERSNVGKRRNEMAMKSWKNK